MTEPLQQMKTRKYNKDYRHSAKVRRHSGQIDSHEDHFSPKKKERCQTAPAKQNLYMSGQDVHSPPGKSSAYWPSDTHVSSKPFTSASKRKARKSPEQYVTLAPDQDALITSLVVLLVLGILCCVIITTTVLAMMKRIINRGSQVRPRSTHYGTVNSGIIINTKDDFESAVGETDCRQHVPSDFIDFGGMDINNDSGLDTDLEEEHDKCEENDDRTGRTIYLDTCKQEGVIPVSYFLRHMFDSTLEMKHHGLGPQGIKPVSTALVSNTHVLTLDLTDNWLGQEGGHHVCEMLKENCYITNLDLTDNRLDHLFAEQFIEVFLNNNTLTHVTLTGNNFDDRAATHLAEGIMSTARVEVMNISRNQLSDISGQILGPAISENTSIKHLDISWNSIRKKGAVAIALGIKNNIRLEVLNLSWNGFGNDGAKALGDSLKVNSTLKELDISNNRITTEGAVLFGKGIAVNDSIRTIKMGKNPMQSAGCYAISAAIMRNPNSAMKELDFTDIIVNTDFYDVFNKMREQVPDIKLRHGGDGFPQRPKARVHPMVKLQNYIAKHNLKLLDFFNKFDSDGSMSVSREEFTEGIQETGIRLTDNEITFLLDELDKDGDGEINYSEMVMGHQDFTEKERKMVTTIMQYKSQ